jgi:hypothetical protein
LLYILSVAGEIPSRPPATSQPVVTRDTLRQFLRHMPASLQEQMPHRFSNDLKSGKYLTIWRAVHLARHLIFGSSESS